MSKTLCDWSRKDIERDLERLAEIVRAPRWICRKCARAASADRYLCKPRPLPGEAEEDGWKRED